MGEAGTWGGGDRVRQVAHVCLELGKCCFRARSSEVERGRIEDLRAGGRRFGKMGWLAQGHAVT